VCDRDAISESIKKAFFFFLVRERLFGHCSSYIANASSLGRRYEEKEREREGEREREKERENERENEREKALMLLTGGGGRSRARSQMNTEVKM